MNNKFVHFNEIEFQPKPNHCRFQDLTGQIYGRLAVIGFCGRFQKSRFGFANVNVEAL